MDLKVFSDQISEDLKRIMDENIENDPKLSNVDYAFNYWIHLAYFNLAEDLIEPLITEYKDNKIDSYYYDELDKKLYIFQNKYYSADTRVTRNEVVKFTSEPIAFLLNGKYKNDDLQEIFNIVKNDDDASIEFIFNITNNINDTLFEEVFPRVNQTSDSRIKCRINYMYNNLKNLYDLYHYGEIFNKDKKPFKFLLPTDTKMARIKGKSNTYDSYYITVNVQEIHKILSKAKKEKYEIFDKNVRSYLGNKTKINSGIQETLKDKKEKYNFVYYNNGLTIVCDEIGDPNIHNGKAVEIKNPQIINGCQSASSIYDLIENDLDTTDPENSLEGVYIFVKLIQIEKNQNDEDVQNFYMSLVEYSNKQKELKDSSFLVKYKQYQNLKKDIHQYGFYLLLKQGERSKINDLSSKIREINLEKATDLIMKIDPDFKFTNAKGTMFELGKILQIVAAFTHGSNFAYNKISKIKNPQSKEFREFFEKIHDYFTTIDFLKLYYIYICSDMISKKDKTEQDQSNGKVIPLFILSFIGYFAPSYENKEEFTDFIKNSLSLVKLKEIVDFFQMICRLYTIEKMTIGVGGNDIIKQKIDSETLEMMVRHEVNRKSAPKVVEEMYNNYKKRKPIV